MRADLTYCDFLVLAPLQIEIEGLESALRATGWDTIVVNTMEFPRVIEATIVDASVAHFRRHIIIVQLNHQGVLNACADTARALELYEPGYVVSFGLAGSFQRDEAPIGAVVFATSLIYYEPSKDKSKSTLSRMDLLPIGDDLLNPFRTLALDEIRKVDGPFASGEKLVADIASSDRKRILATNDKTLGVEMEAAGVGRAVRRLCPWAEFVVIKGISDMADRNKNRVSEEEQSRNRKSAASNAGYCLAQLMRRAPLRRAFRSFPRASEEAMPQTAMSEARLILNTLEPYGIRANFAQLYACLYGRRGPIPVYFHWGQHTHALHWIDFKILTAMRALPKEIVTPIPLVTIVGDDVGKDQPWYSSVHKLLGVYPTTNHEIKAQCEEISRYINRVGFTHSAEQEVRSELEKLSHTGRQEITLNLMRYMLGQFCHRRLFVFTWKSYRAKWEQLSQAFGTWFSIFEWESMCLDGRPGKQEPPGRDLQIEPGSYTSLHNWLAQSPAPEVVQEFVDHFRCHQDPFLPSPHSSQQEPFEQLKSLMLFWDRFFWGLA